MAITVDDVAHEYLNEGRGVAKCACMKWSVRLSELSTDEDRASTFAYRKWEIHVRELVVADEVYDRATEPCTERDHRRWRCHYAQGHKGDHAFDDSQEMAHMRRKLAAIHVRLESGKSYQLAQDIQAILEGEV